LSWVGRGQTFLPFIEQKAL